MTNFTKRKTKKKHNKNNRKKRTRKLSGGTPPTSKEIQKVKIQKQKLVSDIKKMIVGQKKRHPQLWDKERYLQMYEGVRPAWLNILYEGNHILPGINGIAPRGGTIYDYITYRDLFVSGTKTNVRQKNARIMIRDDKKKYRLDESIIKELTRLKEKIEKQLKVYDEWIYFSKTNPEYALSKIQFRKAKRNIKRNRKKKRKRV